jgi:hypothetical protein
LSILLYIRILIKNLVKKNNIDFWNRPYKLSKYQWLPSEFKIDVNGKCKIESYINNLPITENNLYKNIEELFEELFEEVLPYFENIWSSINKNKVDTSLKNRNLQVITKIVKIKLKENQDLIGAWHVEGMSHENIVATVSITLEQTENFLASIYFKRTYLKIEENILLNSIYNPYSELNKMLNTLFIPLGKINIKQGNVIAFPNSYIHKINMKNNGKNEQERTIIVFWLVNPNIRITSTKDINQQSYNILEAKKNRLELMKERTYYKQSFNHRDLNLCEH